MAPIQKKELAPGDSTVVELIFNTRTSKGKVNKNAKITSNDSTKTALSIDFIANIISEPDTVSTLRFSPTQLSFSLDSTKFVVMVENHDSTVARLVMAGQPMNNLVTKIKDDAVKPGKKTKLEFRWTGTALPEYEEDRVISFDTGMKGTPRFSIPYVIKGQKGPKPGTAPQHVTTPPSKPVTAGAAKPMQVSKDPTSVKAPEKGNQPGPESGQRDIYKQYTPDSVKVDKPLPDTHQWPPK